MEVRHPLPAERFACVRLLRDAHAAGGLPFRFSAPHAMALVDKHMIDPDRLGLVMSDGAGPVGILLASAQEHPFAAVRYAFETVWWIDPGARGQGAGAMLDAYEAWAAKRGCLFAGLAALASFPRAGIIYRRRGYRETETHFLKPLAAE